jgi:hypothetical protein
MIARERKRVRVDSEGQTLTLFIEPAYERETRHQYSGRAWNLDDGSGLNCSLFKNKLK